MVLVAEVAAAVICSFLFNENVGVCLINRNVWQSPDGCNYDKCIRCCILFMEQSDCISISIGIVFKTYCKSL